ncbi:NADP-dependent 3-hydroxy acid dehydrogenase YdfG [Streptosporangium becharense]|uniref:NADP-dependent 3-hydroxy acid dehydrogenase YdfG n=1 Tax=Streptosporangium becharense TaxID=1816182 RepID=A0A7W9IF87_9ACTN|nr:SDR family oxidoreductase [Streptosporangium becharense]MBB2910021.1 NADP-dependent 3-hydroxy acid dehydrogenase YdfG [Streptosporangium becharense]MBB5819024.1 NADP-dependent 3-hydroxy acid dehydrogenase YdfG [Streptosporangium becharense]
MSARPTALVTGASRGIGAAVARALAPTYDVLLGGRDAEALAAMCAELSGARPWPVELTSVTGADVAGIDRLDVLVHSAGVMTLGRIEETPAEVWRRTMEVNVVAVAELTRLLLPALRAARGHVVLINSGSGQRANPAWTSYSASKFALRAFADGLRLEERELRVTTVYPGRSDTDMQRGLRAQEGGAYEPEKYLAPDSVARAVVAAVTATPDAHITEITVRPAGGSPN